MGHWCQTQVRRRPWVEGLWVYEDQSVGMVKMEVIEMTMMIATKRLMDLIDRWFLL